jgi:putative intracellular protease/amidase
MPKKVLLVATNYGAWAEEVQAPWDALTSAGHSVVLATPLGKKPLPLTISMDPNFVDPRQGYIVNPPEVCERVKQLLAGEEWEHAIRLTDARLADYGAIVLTGGPGVNLDVNNNRSLHRLLLEAYRSDRLIGALCYSLAALAFTRDPTNSYRSIIFGRTVVAHPRAWDFEEDLEYTLYGATPENAGTDVITPGFLVPLQDVVTDAVGPEGRCISNEKANRLRPQIAYDWPFVTGTSVESAIAYGAKIVEVLRER